MGPSQVMQFYYDVKMVWIVFWLFWTFLKTLIWPAHHLQDSFLMILLFFLNFSGTSGSRKKSKERLVKNFKNFLKGEFNAKAAISRFFVILITYVAEHVHDNLLWQARKLRRYASTKLWFSNLPTYWPGWDVELLAWIKKKLRHFPKYNRIPPF